MNTLRDYLNDMIINYQDQIDHNKDQETARYEVIEDTLVEIINRLIDP